MRDLQLAFISNRTTSRIFRILATIERKRYFTISELAKRIKVTERTIASDLSSIRDHFGESIELTSGNSGFVFEENKPSVYKKRKQQLLDNECLFEIVGNIFYGKFNRVDELADHYHFSESSFRRMLNQSNQALNSYGLQWASNPLTIQGDESNLRKFFKDFYYEGIDTKYTVLPDLELIELALNYLEGKLGNYIIGSGTTPTAYYYTFSIAIQRAKLGFAITLPEDIKIKAYEAVDFPLLHSLTETIERFYEMKMPKEEFAWIFLVTIGKRTLDQENQEKRFYNHFNNGKEITDLTKSFLHMHELIEKNSRSITTFIRSFFLSRYINHRISSVLNKEMDDLKEMVLRSQPETYKKNLVFLKKNAKNVFGGSPYLEDICVSLTIYSELILDTYTPSKEIYFLLEGDHFICQYIRTRATQQFGTKHKLTFLPIQSLTTEFLDVTDVDLIVTNYSRYVSDYINEQDYILLRQVPNDEDWQLLEKKINPYRKKLL
ncbi:hypothetical protein IGK30_003499 [Enterococcus sp. AZ178]|uniref:helix-turn-helix domain-containing protein n=1 Tax=Enterococcus sp. AZ178 TaxID=2774822 RepID=UPI003F240623